MVNALPSGLAVSPRAAATLKRSLVLAIPFGGFSLVILALLGHPLAGLFVLVGLGIGIVAGVLAAYSKIRSYLS